MIPRAEPTSNFHPPPPNRPPATAPPTKAQIKQHRQDIINLQIAVKAAELNLPVDKVPYRLRPGQPLWIRLLCNFRFQLLLASSSGGTSGITARTILDI